MRDTPEEDSKPFLDSQDKGYDESSNKLKIFNNDPEKTMIKDISSLNLIDTDPEDFSLPYYKMPRKRLFSLGLLFIGQSFVLALQNTIPMLMSLMNFFYLRNFKDPIYQSAVTVTESFVFSVFMPVYIGLYELTAVQCSKHYGAKNYAKCTASFVQTLSLLILIFTPMILLS